VQCSAASQAKAEARYSDPAPAGAKAVQCSAASQAKAGARYSVAVVAKRAVLAEAAVEAKGAADLHADNNLFL